MIRPYLVTCVSLNLLRSETQLFKVTQLKVASRYWEIWGWHQGCWDWERGTDRPQMVCPHTEKRVAQGKGFSMEIQPEPPRLLQQTEKEFRLHTECVGI